MHECPRMEVESQRDHGDIEEEEANVENEEDAPDGVQAMESIGDLIDVSSLSSRCRWGECRP